jgi:hypothetical protein
MGLDASRIRLGTLVTPMMDMELKSDSPPPALLCIYIQ